MSMGSQTIAMNYELDEEEINEIIIEDLKDYIRCLIGFLKEPDYEDAKKDKVMVKHLKAVLKAYMDRTEYKEFLEELNNE
jgi:tRNA C32,U32 (ribose-2'-O)-methylase TrmJ